MFCLLVLVESSTSHILVRQVDSLNWFRSSGAIPDPDLLIWWWWTDCNTLPSFWEKKQWSVRGTLWRSHTGCVWLCLKLLRQSDDIWWREDDDDVWRWWDDDDNDDVFVWLCVTRAIKLCLRVTMTKILMMRCATLSQITQTVWWGRSGVQCGKQLAPSKLLLFVLFSSNRHVLLALLIVYSNQSVTLFFVLGLFLSCQSNSSV